MLKDFSYSEYPSNKSKDASDMFTKRGLDWGYTRKEPWLVRKFPFIVLGVVIGSILAGVVQFVVLPSLGI